MIVVFTPGCYPGRPFGRQFNSGTLHQMKCYSNLPREFSEEYKKQLASGGLDNVEPTPGRETPCIGQVWFYTDIENDDIPPQFKNKENKKRAEKAFEKFIKGLGLE